MAKLMAPNIRIDWYPENHFQDIHNPTLEELNSGYNLSHAIVTGFTLDFTDPTTETSKPVFDSFGIEFNTRNGYEANLQFFLAPRSSNKGNEKSFRLAEELFYTQNNPVGYLVKRFGYPADMEYRYIEDLYDYMTPGGVDIDVLPRLDIFKVQADIPKVLVEDDGPILLEVRFIPLGEAVSASTVPWIPPKEEYFWMGDPGFADSVYYSSDGVQIKRNIYPDPSFEYGNTQNITSSTASIRSVWGNALYGNRALEITFTSTGSVVAGQQVHFELKNDNFVRGHWVGYSFNAKSDVLVHAQSEIFPSSGRHLYERRTLDSEYRNIRSDAVFIPEDNDKLRLTIFFRSRWDFHVDLGEKVYIDGMNIVVGDSKESVLDQLETYFDGDGERALPERARDYVEEVPYSWEGEPNFSPSILRDGDVVLARNLMPNPAFRESVRGWELIDDGGRDFYHYGYSLYPSGEIGSSTTGTFATVRNTNEGLPQIPDGSNWVAGRFYWSANRWNDDSDAVFSVSVELLDNEYTTLANYTIYRSTDFPPQTYRWAVPTVSGATQLRLILHTEAITGYLHNIGGSIEYVMVTAGTTFEEAAEQLRYFFDGEEVRPTPIVELEKPEVLYGWLGEPHNSPSVKLVDGVEVARNLIFDPQISGEDSWTLPSSTTVEIVERGELFPWLPDHVTTVASVSGSGGSVYISSASFSRPAAVPGKWYAFAVSLALPEGKSDRVLIQMTSSNAIYAGTGEMGPNGGVFTVAAQAQEGDGDVWVVIWPSGVSDEPFYVAGAVLVEADTEQAALDGAATYFDGDTV